MSRKSSGATHRPRGRGWTLARRQPHRSRPSFASPSFPCLRGGFANNITNWICKRVCNVRSWLRLGWQRRHCMRSPSSYGQRETLCFLSRRGGLCCRTREQSGCVHHDVVIYSFLRYSVICRRTQNIRFYSYSLLPCPDCSPEPACS